MLKAENLVLHVEDNGAKKCLLDHISFQVDDGEMLVITGPNGGGKSTLAKVLIGIEKAESGKIFLNGEDITDFFHSGFQKTKKAAKKLPFHISTVSHLLSRPSSDI